MKGRDGNVHRGLPAEGYMAPISHLGSTVAFVIGCLFAKRLDGKLPGPVGVAFCGDGTTSTELSRSRQYGERGAAASGARGNQ